MNQVPGGGRFDEFAPYDEPMPMDLPGQPSVPSPNVADQGLLDAFAANPASKQFGLTATYDPTTNEYVTDLSGAGFAGQTKRQTPGEFAAELGMTGQPAVAPQPLPMPLPMPIPMPSAEDINRAQQAAAAAAISSPFGAPLQRPINRGAMMGGVAGMPGGKARGGRTRLY